MKTRLIYALAMTCLFALPSQAQSKWIAKVKREVSCNDIALKDELTSFLSRELRSLGDVDLTDNGSQGVYAIRVIVVPSVVNGKTIGQAISMAVTQRALCATDIPASVPGNFLVGVTYNDLVYYTLYVFAADNLRSGATQMVVDFDTEVMKEARILYNRPTPPKK